MPIARSLLVEPIQPLVETIRPPQQHLDHSLVLTRLPIGINTSSLVLILLQIGFTNHLEQPTGFTEVLPSSCSHQCRVQRFLVDSDQHQAVKPLLPLQWYTKGWTTAAQSVWPSSNTENECAGSVAGTSSTLLVGKTTRWHNLHTMTM